MSEYNPILATTSFVLGGVVTSALLFAVILSILAAGDAGEAPGKCRNSHLSPESVTSPGLRDVVTDQQLANQFQRRWDDFEAQLDAGNPASVTFDEGELTSRAAQWLDETHAPLQDVTICIYDSKAEARARAEIPYIADLPLLGDLYKTDVRVLGRIDLTGRHPEIMVIEMHAGDIPDWAMAPIRDDVTDIINGRLHDYDSEHTYTVTYREGQLEITGQP